MRAIDTNVVVRFLTGDDKRQAGIARAVIEAGSVFIPITVCLETEWVLRSGYGFDGDAIAEALRALAGLPGVFVEEPGVLGAALDAMSAGMDFADAVHIAKSEACASFLTFDRRLAKAQKGRFGLKVELL